MTMPRTLLRLIAPALLAASAGLATLPAQATDVGVSIGFSQPGVYGRIDIGRYPQPVLIAQQPVYVGRHVYRDPVYLWVPPGHRRDWRRHCGQYGACGAPVYFVEDRWYHNHVVAERRDRRDWDDRRGRGHDHDRGHDRSRDRDRGHDRDHRDGR